MIVSLDDEARKAYDRPWPVFWYLRVQQRSDDEDPVVRTHLLSCLIDKSQFCVTPVVTTIIEEDVSHAERTHVTFVDSHVKSSHEADESSAEENT